MSDPFTDLVLAAAELKIAAHPQYNAFIGVLKAVEEKHKADLLAAPPEQIFVAQGKAQMARQFRQKMEDCIKLRDDIQRRK